MIELDGSFEEGGGQILRTALGLSIITKKPFRIKDIRKNREKPGLKPQHLHCVKACVQLSNAFVEGNTLGSGELEFIPRALKNRQMEVHVGTAGSTMLVLQSLILPLLFTESEVKITGGTDVSWSIPYDYFRTIILPILKQYGTIDVTCDKRGYFPKGGGLVTVQTKPTYKILDFDGFNTFHQYVFGNPIKLFKEGKLLSCKGISHASMDLQEGEVAERQASSSRLLLQRNAPTHMDVQYANTESTGSGIVLYGLFECSDGAQYRLGADALGSLRVKAEEVGRQASEKLIKLIKSNVVVDEHLQDNIIPLLGLFGGRIKTGKITPHTKANIYVCEQFLDVEYIIEPAEIGESQSEANFISVLSSSKS